MENFRARSTTCDFFPESGHTQPTQSPRSLSISRSPLSKRTRLVLCRDFSTCDSRSIRQPDETKSGSTQPCLFRKNLQRFIIQRSSISARSSVFHAHRNVRLVPLKNSAGLKIPNRCRLNGHVL